ncbi:iodotyrosine dehalogenase, putative, partial [Perkinsus marinus ATCC 50983]
MSASLPPQYSTIDSMSNTSKIGICLGVAAAAVGAAGVFAAYKFFKSDRPRSGSLLADPDNHLAEEEVLQGHEVFRHDRQTKAVMMANATKFLDLMNTRRSIRFYSKDDVPMDIIMAAVRTACTAPSGAHLQPWTFVIVHNQKAKDKIRDVVEREEQLNYDRRMRRSWVNDVAPMVGDLHRDGRVAKPYLSEAPYLIVMMKQSHRVDPTT